MSNQLNAKGIERHFRDCIHAGQFDRIENGNTFVFDINASDRYNYPELQFIKQIRVKIIRGTLVFNRVPLDEIKL